MFFRKVEKPHYCQQCRHAYEPRPQDKTYGYLCLPCAKEPHERERRFSRVMEWARLNWEKLEPQAKEHFAAQDSAYAKALQQSMNQQQSDMYQRQNRQTGLTGQGSIASMLGLG